MHYLKIGFRQLLKSPGFFLVAVVTLALGIGSCTAMFSVIHAVLLKPLPFKEPDRLVWIENGSSGGLSARTSRTDVLRAWREQNQSFESISAYFAFFDYGRLTITGHGEPERRVGVAVSENFIDSLGIPLSHGRNFTAEESESLNSPGAVILSHDYWLKQFGGDPSVVGSTLTINNRSTTIVGVLDPSFDFSSTFSPGSGIDMITPFPINGETARWGNTVFAIGRLKPGITLEDARAEFEILTPRIVEELDFGYGGGFHMQDVNEALRGSFRTPFFVLAGAVACVLAIACANLSNLLLARLNHRRREIAVRVALGAGKRHLLQQTLTESMILAVSGTLLGIPLAVAGTHLLVQLETFGVPLLQNAAVNQYAMLVTVGLTILAGIACGVLPALFLARSQQGSTTTGGTHQQTAGHAFSLARDSLIVAEVALAFVLLVGAGLLVRSFGKLLEVELGFKPQQALAIRVDTIREFENRSEELPRYYDDLVDSVARLPGVDSVGLSDCLPFGRNRTWGVGVKDVQYPQGEYPIAFPRIVDSGYLETMNIPLISGRYFDEGDAQPDAPRTVIINENLARRLFGDGDPLGQILTVNGDSRVIGVVANVRHGSLEEAGGNEMYLNYHQGVGIPGMEMVIRSSRPLDSLLPEIRATLAEKDPMLPTSESYPLELLIKNAVGPRLLITQLLGIFSVIALSLAAIGLYGVIAFSVAQRTREIGIRVAIGAQRKDVLSMVMSSGLKRVGLGTGIGLLASLALTRILQSMLFGVEAFDPITLSQITMILMAVSVAACLLPALKATRVDPITALHCE